MGTINDRLKKEFKNFPRELWEDIKQDKENHQNEIILYERKQCIRKATSAFLEAKIPKERIISLLQKYWDLRRSEAEMFLKLAEYRAKKDKAR